MCICTGIQRKGEAIAATVNRTKPSAKELLSIFEGHIADGTLALCDGLRSYHVLLGIAECIVKDCNDPSAEDACFYNLTRTSRNHNFAILRQKSLISGLNTVNEFHSFIKRRCMFCRGVTSKYINRYNALFQRPIEIQKASSSS